MNIMLKNWQHNVLSVYTGPVHTHPEIFWICNFLFPDLKISPPTSYRSCGFNFFPLWRAGIQKYSDSPDACGRKSYLERKSCGFKNIRIRERGLSASHFLLFYSLRVQVPGEWTCSSCNKKLCHPLHAILPAIIVILWTATYSLVA